MNGVVVPEVTSTGEHGPELVSVDYPLAGTISVSRIETTDII